MTSRGRLIAGLLAILLLAAAVADLDGGWRTAAFGVAGILALSAALVGQVAHPVVFAGANLILVSIFCWSLAESTPIQLSVRGDRLQARAGGELVQARDGRLQEGSVAVWLSGSDSDRPSRAVPPVLDEQPWLRALLAPAYAGYRGGLDRLSVTGDGTPVVEGVTIWQDRADLTQVLLKSAARDVEIQGQALRLSTPFGLLVRVSPEGEAYQALARPESRDLALQRTRGGRLVQELENRGSPYRVSLVAAIQSVVRELGRTWLFGLLLVAMGAFVSAVASACRGAPCGLPLDRGRQQPSAGGHKAPPLHHRRTAIALAGLALLATGAAAWISLVIFGGVPHDRDSVAYLFQARLFAHAAAFAPVPSMPEFFKEDFIVVHAGRWFGKYPPGHPLALALGMVAGAPWAVNPALAGVAAALLGALGWRLFGPWTGLLSAALLVTSPFFLFMSGSYLAHPTALALTLAALLVAAPVGAQRRSLQTGLLLGLLLGALMATRQLTGVSIAACLMAWLASPRLDPQQTLRRRAEALVAVGCGALLPLFGLLCFQFLTTGNPLVSPQTVWWEFDRIGFGAGVGPDGRHDLESGLHDTWDRLTELQRHLFGWPFYLTLAPAMIPFLAGRASKRDWWLLSIIVILVVAYVLYWARGMAYGPRYYYEAMGPLCLLSVRGFGLLAALASANAPSGRDLPGRVIAGAVPAVLLAFNLVFYLPGQLDEFRGYLGVDGRRAQTVRAAGVDHGLVFVREEPRGAWQPYASLFWLNSPWLDSPLVFARDRGAEENARLQALYPDRPAFLLSASGLTPIAAR